MHAWLVLAIAAWHIWKESCDRLHEETDMSWPEIWEKIKLYCKMQSSI